MMVARPPRNDYPDLQAIGRLVEAQTPENALILASTPCRLGLYAERAFMDIVPIKGSAPGGGPRLDAMLRRSAPFSPRYFLSYAGTVEERRIEAELRTWHAASAVIANEELRATLLEVRASGPSGPRSALSPSGNRRAVIR